MRIYIDADGCPVVNLTLQVAARYGVGCTLVCDTSHVFDCAGAEVVVVSKGADSADFALVNRISAGDLVITQDYGLAAMCLARGAVGLNQNGLRYTDDNIGALLTARHTAGKIRRSGGRLKGPAKRASAQNEAFAASLERLLEKTVGQIAPASEEV